MGIRRGPAALVLLLLTAGCAKGTAPMEEDYRSPELTASLAAAPDGDRWAAIVEFSDPYWQGKPIDG